MFRRGRSDAKPARAAAEPFTYIHHGTTLEGRLEAQGRVRVHGTVRGDVEVDGVLEVAEGGLVEGARVRADEVRVLGTVRADVECRGKIEIWKDGLLEGDVRAAALDIEEGAGFTGRSEMIRAGAPSLGPGSRPAALDAGAASAAPPRPLDAGTDAGTDLGSTPGTDAGPEVGGAPDRTR